MSSSCSSKSSGSSRLSLTKKEMNLPPWNQMLHNGAINPDCVVTTESTKSNSTLGDISDQEDYFSDEDSSKRRMQATNGTPVLQLRDYQKELAVNALHGDNTIICAPTGSGKTRVATFIILEHFKRASGKKMIAFIAKTVPLAVQQYNALLKYLPNHEIILLTGQSGEPNCLHMLLTYIDIVVMTPQILENHLGSHLNKKLLPHLGVFSMLVFDECHHTRKKDPYNVLMTSYLKLKDRIRTAKSKGEDIKLKLPQIVGLTATIGVDKAVTVEEAKDNIMKVCANLDAYNMSTVQRHKEELKKVVPVPEEKLKPLRERDEDDCAKKLQQIMEKLEKELKHHVKELNDKGFCLDILKDLPVNRKRQDYGQWAVKSKKEAKEVAIYDPERETNVPVRLTVIILGYLIAYHEALETYDLVELIDVIKYLENCFQEYQSMEGTVGENKYYKYFEELKKLVMARHCEENPNLQILAKVLKRYLVKRGDKSRGIIFVKTRALALALSSWLSRCGIEKLRNLNACSFTGSNVPEEKGGTSQAHQEAIIQRFHSGEIRLLVATSVAEEGLDIPECNLVIKYNHVGSEVSTVQTRGRSRAFGGVSVLLAMPKILQREHINQCRVKYMKEAIDLIQGMDRKEFEKVVEKHQETILRDIKISELLRRTKKVQPRSVPFRMVCALCRKVAIDGKDVKIVSGSQHVSIDRKLLDHIEVIPDKQPKEIGDCLLVGTVKCRGEPEPGSKCNQKLGRVVKHEQIPYIVLDVTCFAFDLGDQRNLDTFKKWKEAPFTIEELSYDDIESYLEDDRVHAAAADKTDDKDISLLNDDSSDDEDNAHKRTSKRRYSDDDSDSDDSNSDDDNGDNTEVKSSTGSQEFNQSPDKENSVPPFPVVSRISEPAPETLLQPKVTSANQTPSNRVSSGTSMECSLNHIIPRQEHNAELFIDMLNTAPSLDTISSSKLVAPLKSIPSFPSPQCSIKSADDSDS